MKPLILICLVGFFLQGNFLFAQQEVIEPDTTERPVNLGGLIADGNALFDMFYTFDNRYKGVIGTPLIYDDWVKGSVKMKKGNAIAKDVMLNIDGEKSTVWANMGTKGQISILSEFIGYVSIQTPTALEVFVPYPRSLVEDRNENQLCLYQQLYHSDQYELLKKREAIFQKADYKDPYSADTRYDKFIKKESYYLKVDGEYNKIKLKRKAILKVLPLLSKMEGWKGTLLNDAKLVSMLALLDQSKN